MLKERWNNFNEVNSDIAALKQWMETPEASGLMDRLAHSVRNAAISRNLPLSFINKDPYGSRTDSELLQEIRAELTLFLLENAGRLKIHSLMDEPGFPAFLKQRFLSRWLSASRNLSTDPFRYLYKRAQDILREEPGFFTLAKKGHSTAYSKMPQNRAIPPLIKEDLGSVPFPPEYARGSTQGDVKTKAVILGLAAYFLGSDSRALG